MKGIAFVVLLVACVPSAESIGDTSWTVPIDESRLMRAGRAGHVAIARGSSLEVRGPNGAMTWQLELSGEAIDLAVDDTGGVIAFHRTTPLARESTLARFSEVGVSRWSVNRTADANVALTQIVRDRDDATWLLAHGFPGEPFWERYAANGDGLGTGTLPARVRGPMGAPAALPDGGFAYGDDADGIRAIDATGSPLWRIDVGPGSGPFAVHEDGEITVRGNRDVVRFDVTRAVRWRVATFGSSPTVVALDDDSVVLTSTDGLGNTYNVPVLIRIDRAGGWQREIAREELDFVEVVRAPATRAFRVYAGRVRFDDRHYELSGRTR